MLSPSSREAWLEKEEENICENFYKMKESCFEAHKNCGNFCLLPWHWQIKLSMTPIFSLYTLQDRSGQRQELVGVVYDTNVLGFKGPRRMTVLLPGMNSEGRRIDYKAVSSHDGLIVRYKGKNLEGILAHHSGRNAEELAAAMDRDNFMSPQEAKDFGLIDHVVTRPDAQS